MTHSSTGILRLLLLVLYLSCTNASAQENITDPHVIRDVEFLAEEATSPPTNAAPWQPTQLPYGERIADPEASDRILWMRFNLDTPSADTLHSLYFYRYNLSLEVFFNGEKIGGDSFRAGRQTVSWNHPRLIDIQNANWQDAGNTVHVRMRTSYFGGTFAPILFGENTSLQPLYEERLFRQVRINEWLQAGGIIVTLLALALWSARREDLTYAYFAGMTASWTLVTTHMIIYYNVIDYRYWLPLVHIAIDIWALLLYFFLSSITRQHNPRAEVGVKFWFAAAICWHLFAPLKYWWLGAYAVHVVANLFLVYLMSLIVLRAIRYREFLSIAISAAILLQVAFFAHDITMVLFTEGEEWEGAMYWSQFGFPVLLAVFTANLLSRFTSALSLAENLNRDLEAKVEHSRVIIERSYAEKRELELAQAAEKERLSIYRDLHDDVGSKLLSIVHAGRDNKLGELARTALESLRSAVSRANSPDQPLTQFLEQLGEETKLRLEGSGHRLIWRQSEVDSNAILSSDTVFNLNQIFREAVSNIIRHANASEVEVEIQCSDSQLRFEIEDNGCGIQNQPVHGNGLNNIRLRAEELDAKASWNNLEGGGLKVSLELSDPFK